MQSITKRDQRDRPDDFTLRPAEVQCLGLQPLDPQPGTKHIVHSLHVRVLEDLNCTELQRDNTTDHHLQPATPPTVSWLIAQPGGRQCILLLHAASDLRLRRRRRQRRRRQHGAATETIATRGVSATPLPAAPLHVLLCCVYIKGYRAVRLAAGPRTCPTQVSPSAASRSASISRSRHSSSWSFSIDRTPLITAASAKFSANAPRRSCSPLTASV